jgi:predicted enzyme related to lactoylglutathione lyase
MTEIEIRYVNVYVTDLARSVEFFEKTLGLPLQFSDAGFGYASLDAGPVRLGLAQIDAADPLQRALAGKQTGVGFAVSDLTAAHGELAARGVKFTMEPARQPWGGFMGMISDPDGNLFYLDEIREA